MARIAIVVIPFFGHINPTVSLGQVLIDRGHEVVWIIARDIAGLNIPEKGKLFFTNEKDDTEIMRMLQGVNDGNSKAGLEGSKEIMEEVLMPLAIKMMNGLDRLLEQFQPDVLIHDEQTYAGAFCAFRKKIPYVTTHAAPSGIFENAHLESITGWYFSSLRKLQTQFGISSDTLVQRSPDLGLVFCPRDFSDTNALLSGQRFVGPCLDVSRKYSADFDFLKIADRSRKNILVSLGTLLTNEAESFFSKVIEDFEDSPYRIIVAADPSIFEEWPENFIVQKRLPHLEILKYLDLVISHGGANTVCDSIGMGIPLIVTPMNFDQYYVADQIANNQLGLRFKYKRLRKNDLRKASEILLEEDNLYKKNVLALSRDFLRGGGANRAADYVEEHLNHYPSVVPKSETVIQN